MSVRYIASKVTAVAGSVALVGGGAAWIATATGAGQQQPAAVQQDSGTIVQRVYLVQRVTPDGSTYFEPLTAPPAAQPAAVSRAVTRTRAS